MFEALSRTGELWRPTRADHTGRCSCCGGAMVATPTKPRGFQWAHDCGGPGDGWRKSMGGLLGQCGFKPIQGGSNFTRGRTCVLLADGWRTTQADAAEMVVAVAGWLPIWMVDARDVAVSFGRGTPGAASPSWVMGAAGTRFAATWLSRTSAPAVLHLRAPAGGYPDGATDAVYFAVESPHPGTGRPRGGELAGTDSVWADGRATTLRDFVMVASNLETAMTRTVVSRGARVAAPFSGQPVHTLDLPPWMSDGTRTDRSFDAHQRRMAARRSH